MNTPDNMPRQETPVTEAPKTPAKPQTVYKSYTFKEKWLPGLLLSLFAPFALLFFDPFEIYGSNMDEFKFVLWDFWGLCALFAVLAAGVLFGLFALMRGRVFDIFYGLIFGLSVMLFVQGNYLSYGVDSLEGDGVGNTISLTQIIINLLVWILVVAGCVAAMLLLDRFRDMVRTVTTVGAVALVGMTLITFITVSLTTDVYAAEKQVYDSDQVGQEVLTVKNLDTLATDNNVVFFIVDRFDYNYYVKAMKDCPEIFDELDGFTFFGDYVTRYPRTYPGVPHIITGAEVDFSVSRLDYMKNAYGNSAYLTALKDAGCDINVYTDSYYGYENAAHMRPYVSNTSGNVSYEIVNRPNLTLDMIRISLYRNIPFVLRHTLGNISTPMYDKYVSYGLEDEVYRTDMKAVYGQLTDGDFTFREAEKGVSYIHVSGCHLPNMYGENFDKATQDEKYDSNVSLKQSFKIINAYLEEMKRMGVYENATVIITGDHSSIGSDDDPPAKPHITALMVKPAGVSEGEMAMSNAQIAPEDLFATVLKAVGADAADGRTVFEIPEDEERTRTYRFQLVDGTLYEGKYSEAVYEIVGSAHDFDNWRQVSLTDLGKNIYD